MSTEDPKPNELAAALMLEEDTAQRYVNMLNCIHKLSSTEREYIVCWLSLTEERIQNLKSQINAKVALHP